MIRGRPTLTVVDPDRPAQWQEILALSGEMLESARSGAWPRVTEAARRRRERVEAFFSLPVAPHEAEWVAEGIRQVLDLDRELLGLVQAGREECSAAVVHLRKGRESRNAYRACTGH
jgi:hypothetical protein